jgi:hypothetical protein
MVFSSVPSLLKTPALVNALEGRVKEKGTFVWAVAKCGNKYKRAYSR